MTTKHLTRVEVKNADLGEVEAVFATFGVVDSDGDVTVPGAFEDGAQVPISAYGHKSWEGSLPVGVGTIHTAGNEAILKGKFFLGTTSGRDTFEVVKELAGHGQWSYGYDVVKHSFGDHEGKQVRFLEALKTHEVSPVLLGAGVNTRTLTTKGQGRTLAEELTSVLTDVTSVADRAADVMTMRAEKGKGLGAESAQQIELLITELKRLTGLLTQPTGVPEADALRREFLRFIQMTS